MKKTIQLALLCSAISVTGCASFHQEKVAHVDAMPDTSQYQNRPSVYIDFDFYRGKPNENALDVDTAEVHIKPLLEKVVNESNLFSNVSYDETKKAEMDYTITLRAYNHGEVGAAAVMGFITGFTLGVIPSAATDEFSVLVEVTDNTGQTLHNNQNNDAITTWIGIWFIPVMGFTVDEAVNASLENQIKQALKEAFESGTMKYSHLHYLLHSA